MQKLQVSVSLIAVVLTILAGVSSADASERPKGQSQIEPHLGDREGTEAYLWPSQEELARMEVGVPIELVKIDHIELLKPDSQLIVRTPRSDGVLTELLGASEYISSSKKQLVGRTSARTGTKAVAQDLNGTETALEPNEGVIASFIASQDAGGNASPSKLPDPWPRCYLQKLVTYPPVQIAVGSASNSSVSKSTSSFKAGAKARLGVATSVSAGKFGSYNSSSTADVGNSYALSWNAAAGVSRTFHTYAEYAKYKWQCMVPKPTVPVYYVHPTRLVGGDAVKSIAAPTSTKYCLPATKGSKHSKTTTTAVTWSNGVALSSYIGIALSSQSGYTTNTQVQYTFTKAGKICGTQDYFAGSPSRTYTKS